MIVERHVYIAKPGRIGDMLEHLRRQLTNKNNPWPHDVRIYRSRIGQGLRAKRGAFNRKWHAIGPSHTFKPRHAFPRAKANAYEYGIHVPLAICWPARFAGGRQSRALVDLIDVTVLDNDGQKSYVPGMSEGEFTVDGPLDTDGTAGGAWDTVTSWVDGGVNAPITYAETGLTAGSPARLVEGFDTTFDTTATQTGSTENVPPSLR